MPLKCLCLRCLYCCISDRVNTPRKMGGLGPMNVPLIGDKTLEISRKYGCLKEDEGVAFRSVIPVSCLHGMSMGCGNVNKMEIRIIYSGSQRGRRVRWSWASVGHWIEVEHPINKLVLKDNYVLAVGESNKGVSWSVPPGIPRFCTPLSIGRGWGRN